jgi:hypothetical protein
VSGIEQVYAVDAFEQRLDAFLQDRSEEARAVRVGEKETSEQAAIVARYADLFTREQLDALREAEAQQPVLRSCPAGCFTDDGAQ